MDKRTLALVGAMRRLADLVRSDPALSGLAEESQAYANFLTTLDRFVELAFEEQEIATARATLRPEFDALADRLHLDLKCIAAAAGFVREEHLVLPLKKVPTLERDRVVVFAAQVVPMLELAQERFALLVGAGMHPRKLDDVRASLERLLAVDAELQSLPTSADAFEASVQLMRERARRHIDQLSLELRPAMTPDTLARWQSAKSLGRVHRDKALPAPRQKLLPSTASDNVSQASAPALSEDASGDPKDGLGRKAKRAVLRLLGVEEAGDLPEPIGDASVEEIRRLPAAGESSPPTGTDG